MSEPAKREFELRYAVELTKPLGLGRDGSVVLTNHNTAVKFFTLQETFRRERRAYEILSENAVSDIAGHVVPLYLRADDELLAIELGLVDPPYFLDFASAYFPDEIPDFPDEVWDEWHQQKAEEFGERWPVAQSLMNEFERLTGLILLDVNPGNIRFAEEAR